MPVSDSSDTVDNPPDPSSAPDGSAVAAHLKQMWQQMLLIEEIGTTESFPALGGDSLTAIRMLSEVQRVWGVNISLAEFYRVDTISSLAALIEARLASATDTTDEGLAQIGSGEI